jgi:hypothetical protein
MDRDAFDGLTRLLAARPSRRSALAAVLGAALLPAADPLLAARGKKKGRGKRRPGHVQVCHSGETLRVPRYAVKAITRDGGSVGACSDGGGQCALAGQFCGDILGVECCGPFKCTTTASVISNCVLPCTSDAQCHDQFIYNQVSCKADFLTCPFIAGGKCCVAQGCLFDGDCTSPYTCQDGACKR